MPSVYAALAVLPVLVVGARLVGGLVRDLGQLATLGLAGWLCWGADHDILQSLAAAGLALTLYTLYEWVVASSDAAKTTVISRHTGRRLPPI